jgi:hypothetical protein
VSSTAVYLHVGAGLQPDTLVSQDLDPYFSAGRDALVKELRYYKAAALA